VAVPPERRLAFGVDPHRREQFSLRQSRYDAIAYDLNEWARAAARSGKRLSVLDVGCGTGTLLRHLEVKPFFADMVVSATNFYEKTTYKPEAYHEYIVCDLTEPCLALTSCAYDVVVCEQMLEHLPDVSVAMRTLVRVARPGGRLIIGVPIHFPPLDLARIHLVPILDRAVGRAPGTRGHLQVFTLASLRRMLRQYAELRLVDQRGFRIISGGVLRPMENLRWYWRANRWLGTRLTALCPEVQLILERSLADGTFEQLE
jgi:2-polyprenyl-3-methyl-5-hydroxy-6-metoxy-1,4-benzoquinol methylase